MTGPDRPELPPETFQLIKEGDATATRALLARYTKLGRAMARRALCGLDRATVDDAIDDAVVDSFCGAIIWIMTGGYDPYGKAKFSTLFGTRVHWVATDAKRRLRARGQVVEVSLDAVAEGELQDDRESPFDAVARAERGRAVADLIRRLDPGVREVVRAILDGEERDEIATRLGVNTNTVNLRWFHAIATLQRLAVATALREAQ